MKKISLFKKDVSGAEVKSNGDVIEKLIPLYSKEMFLMALKKYPEALRGVDNVIQAIKIHDLIKAAETDVVELEDADFTFLYKAVNAVEWLPIIFQFSEFFTELKRANIS